MKKLSLLLAAILVLTASLFVFTSCGEEDAESKVESGTESVTSEASEASEASEPEETSADVSEETSEPAEESQPDIFVYDIDRTKTKTNVALNKTYELEGEKVFAENYPDTDNKELTDGAIGDLVGSDAAWAGIAKAESPISIVVDLGEAVEGLADFEITALVYDEWGVYLPEDITVYVSEDGTEYYEAGAITEFSEVNEGDLRVETMTLELEKGVKAQYVKFEVTYPGWFFPGEIEISTYE